MGSRPRNMTDYDRTVREFKWEIPEYYNFVLDDFEKWKGDKSKTALVTVSHDGESATRLSFWDLSVLSNKFANALHALGIRRGDRVFLMLPRGEEWYIAM
ncbi:MAG: acyl-CoA synthetase, partial [Spirochaetales bacterium]